MDVRTRSVREGKAKQKELTKYVGHAICMTQNIK